MKSAVCGLSPSWEASRHSPVALEKLLKDEQPPSVQKHRSQSLVLALVAFALNPPKVEMWQWADSATPHVSPCHNTCLARHARNPRSQLYTLEAISSCLSTKLHPWKTGNPMLKGPKP